MAAGALWSSAVLVRHSVRHFILRIRTIHAWKVSRMLGFSAFHSSYTNYSCVESFPDAGVFGISFSVYELFMRGKFFRMLGFGIEVKSQGLLNCVLEVYANVVY